MRIARRHFLTSAAAAATLGTLPRGALAETVDLPFANGGRPLMTFPQKRPMLMLTPRPPQLETPFAVFDQGVFTPNDAFFVRWHLSNIPTRVDADAHRIAVTGAVASPLSLSLADLASYPAVDVAAVNQCSGNSRGLMSPRVAGGQWDNGAMGNALWTGVRLRDILDRAGVTAAAKQVQFEGLDGPTSGQDTPDFKKSLDIDVARHPDIIVAYAMNGTPLPVLNGFPVRLIVPGYYSTYWVKMLSAINVLDHVDDNFWMKTAYRIPDTPDNSVAPGASGFSTIPIAKMRVRSFATNVTDGGTLKTGTPLRGIAFDGGSGIRRVEVSTDGGSTWREASLERDYGPYSFRRWNARLTAPAGSDATIAVRATGNDGATQSATAGWNPSGYLRNVIETYKVKLV